MRRSFRVRTVAPMHALLLSYGLRGADHAEHAEFCEQLSPAVEAACGFVSATWFANRNVGRCGAFYVFATKPDVDAFVASELYDAFVSHRSLTTVAASDFAVLERTESPVPPGTQTTERKTRDA